MSGNVEMMRQELIKAGLSPKIVDSMSADRLEAECRKRNIELQSGLNNNANWGNVEDGFHRETGEVNGKEYELRPMTDEEKGQLRQTGVAPFAGKGSIGVLAGVIEFLGLSLLFEKFYGYEGPEPVQTPVNQPPKEPTARELLAKDIEKLQGHEAYGILSDIIEAKRESALPLIDKEYEHSILAFDIGLLRQKGEEIGKLIDEGYLYEIYPMEKYILMAPEILDDMVKYREELEQILSDVAGDDWRSDGAFNEEQKTILKERTQELNQKYLGLFQGKVDAARDKIKTEAADTAVKMFYEKYSERINAAIEEIKQDYAKRMAYLDSELKREIELVKYRAERKKEDYREEMIEKYTPEPSGVFLVLENSDLPDSAVVSENPDLPDIAEAQIQKYNAEIDASAEAEIEEAKKRYPNFKAELEAELPRAIEEFRRSIDEEVKKAAAIPDEKIDHIVT